MKVLLAKLNPRKSRNEDYSGDWVLYRIFGMLVEFVEGPLADLGREHYGAGPGHSPGEAGLRVWNLIIQGERPEYSPEAEPYEALRDLYVWWTEVRPLRYETLKASWTKEEVTEYAREDREQLELLLEHRHYLTLP